MAIAGGLILAHILITMALIVLRDCLPCLWGHATAIARFTFCLWLWWCTEFTSPAALTIKNHLTSIIIVHHTTIIKHSVFIDVRLYGYWR